MGGAQNQNNYMHHQQQMQAQHQQAPQLHHRLHGTPINPQQFMVPPPAIPQQMQQANQQQIHSTHLIQQQPQSQQAAFQRHNQSASGRHHGQSSQNQHHQQQNQNSSHHHHQQQQHAHLNQNHSHHHHHHQHNQNQHPQMPPPQNMIPRMPMPLRDWPIRCVIEGKYQPVIMGQNASTIRDIAHSTHCRVEFVNLSKRERAVLGLNERILTVHGHAEQASKAVARILDAIQGEALKDDVNVGADIVLRLRAHNQLCGRLIGKMGSSIKEIMEKTGTTITVAKYVEPSGGLVGLRNEEILCLMERTIAVRGPSIEAVVQAESMISAKLKKCYEADTKLRAHQMNTSMPPLPLHPLGVHPPPGGPSSSGGVPPPSLIPTPTGMIQMQHFAPSHYLPPTANNSFLQPGMIQIAPGVTTLRQVKLWVPDVMIGALIGTKGKNIKMIIRETGAAVKIEAPEEKVQREAAEEEKKKLRGAEEGAGDQPSAQEDGDKSTEPEVVVEDAENRPSGEAEQKASERMVTVNGDDLQLLKAQTYIFTKIAETAASLPPATPEYERAYALKIRSEVSVPTKIIGRIIGKGGQNVRELQRITGASVKIPEEERKGGEVYRHEDGLEEEMTMIRSVGNLHNTHNVQFRLAHLIGEYYRSGEHRQKQAEPLRANRSASGASGRASGDASPLNPMAQLGQVPPISTSSNRNSPSSGSAKSKTP
uniref:K Homology domain-containing protein n=1 Tax=Caenorhabditis japonica TaxID=281687 RepID=A0A8R1HM97_CAEJA